MKNKLTPLFITSILFSVGCASFTKEQTLLSKVNNVATVSILDEKLNIRFLKNEKISKDITYDSSNWGINSLISQEMQNSFKMSGKQITPVTIDETVIEDGKRDAAQLKNIYLGNRYQGVQSYILDQSGKQNANYVLILHPAPSAENSSARAGYGLFCPSQSSNDRLVAYLSVGAEIWDVPSQTSKGKTILSFKDLSVETSYSCDQAAKMSSTQLASALRENFEDLSRKAAHLSMRALNLK